jgi:hypothetical protein
MQTKKYVEKRGHLYAESFRVVRSSDSRKASFEQAASVGLPIGRGLNDGKRFISAHGAVRSYGRDFRWALLQAAYVVNDSMEPEKRRIPLSSMIYIGDGPSDIPCFSVVRDKKGNAIGTRRPKKRKKDISKAYEMARGQRITQGPYKADYRPGSEMRDAIEDSILAAA